MCESLASPTRPRTDYLLHYLLSRGLTVIVHVVEADHDIKHLWKRCIKKYAAPQGERLRSALHEQKKADVSRTKQSRTEGA